MLHRRSHMSWLLSASLFSALAVVCLLPAGCGKRSNNGYVAGRVTVSSKPLPLGTVVFENAKSGDSLQAYVDPDGSYVLKTYKEDGLPPGDYRVAVLPDVPHDPLALPAGPPAGRKLAGVAVPAKYRDVTTSPLKATVKEGTNPPFDFDLSP